jgi:hypothetical protein
MWVTIRHFVAQDALQHPEARAEWEAGLADVVDLGMTLAADAIDAG